MKAKAPDKAGGQRCSDSLLEFCDLTFAVHVAVAINFLTANFPVETQTDSLDIGECGIAFIDALLLSSAEGDERVGHRNIKLINHAHLAGFAPRGGQS